ncbi:MAG: hypothetical protein KBF99_16475 [Leptospiraceae bacterium]|nr:hypothetical protein [Leptospiraceae bacterium]MBK9501284.1 hypothetical protein [Leptospiraceae bacterium]MBP9164775.1 hypothetical protein [Leptospiraceae bacterium]
MEEITKPEKVEADSLRDMSVVFFKSLNDFILFTSGYYEMAAEPPRGIVPFLDNPNFVVEVAALQTASVSFMASLFQGRLMIPALAIEYFLNNRIQTEMIFNLLKAKEIVPDEENFLRCLSGIDKDNIDVNDKMVNGILTGSALLARDSFYSTVSHLLDTTPAGQLNITRNALNTVLSAITSYIETRSIATATSKIYNLEEGI